MNKLYQYEMAVFILLLIKKL